MASHSKGCCSKSPGKKHRERAPVKVVHISNPTRIRSTVADFKATVQLYTGWNCSPPVASSASSSEQTVQERPQPPQQSHLSHATPQMEPSEHKKDLKLADSSLEACDEIFDSSLLDFLSASHFIPEDIPYYDKLNCASTSFRYAKFAESEEKWMM